MGSWTFTTTAFGKDAQDAYRNAVKQAQWEDGHDPYNGTISTTNGCFEVQVPEGTTPKQWERIVTAAQVFETWGADEDEWAWSSEADKKELVKKIKAATRRLSPAQIRVAKNVCRSVSKWGDCAAFRLPRVREREWRKANGMQRKKGNVYLFFGIAAS